MNKLYGTVCATITPMTENGEVDYESLFSLHKYMRENGINGIYPNGTNGEGILLCPQERQDIAKETVKNCAEYASVFIQCGSVTPEETAAHAEHAVSIGADGVGIMTPLFFHVDRQALIDYYDYTVRKLPDDFPFYIYNIPSHSNNDADVSVVAALMKKHKNLRGIKFSAPDLMRIEDYLFCSDKKPDVLIGCDSLYLQCLVAGGVGTVSGPAQVFGKRFSLLYKQFLNKDYEGAAETQRRIVETDRHLSNISGIPAIKTLLMMQGVIKNDTCRRPLRPLNEDEKTILREELDKYNKEG